MSRPARRYCRSCGAEAPDEGRFCPSCGSSLSITSPYPAPDGTRHDRAPIDGALPRAPMLAGDERASRSVAVLTPTLAGSVRLGFGFALGMTLFSVLVATLVMVAVAVGTTGLTWPFAEKAQRFDGRGSLESAPILLEGPIRIEWTATPTSPSACRLGARFRATQDAGVNIEIVSTLVERQAASAAPLRFSLARRADYVLSVESDCEWGFRLVNE